MTQLQVFEIYVFEIYDRALHGVGVSTLDSTLNIRIMHLLSVKCIEQTTGDGSSPAFLPILCQPC